MSEKPIKINVPKDPIVIGQTKEGEPVWLDCKDLIPTPDEDAERWDKTLDSRQQAMIDNAAKIVLLNSQLFVEQTLTNAEPKLLTMPCNEVEGFMLQSGFQIIQDGLKTIVKRKGRILREMTAGVGSRWRDHVARKVDQMVSGKYRRN